MLRKWVFNFLLNMREEGRSRYAVVRAYLPCSSRAYLPCVLGTRLNLLTSCTPPLTSTCLTQLSTTCHHRALRPHPTSRDIDKCTKCPYVHLCCHLRPDNESKRTFPLHQSRRGRLPADRLSRPQSNPPKKQKPSPHKLHNDSHYEHRPA